MGQCQLVACGDEATEHVEESWLAVAPKAYRARTVPIQPNQAGKFIKDLQDHLDARRQKKQQRASDEKHIALDSKRAWCYGIQASEPRLSSLLRGWHSRDDDRVYWQGMHKQAAFFLLVSPDHAHDCFEALTCKICHLYKDNCRGFDEVAAQINDVLVHEHSPLMQHIHSIGLDLLLWNNGIMKIIMAVLIDAKPIDQVANFITELIIEVAFGDVQNKLTNGVLDVINEYEQEMIAITAPDVLFAFINKFSMGMAFVDVAEEYYLAQDRCKELVDRIAALGDAQDRKTNILSRSTSASSGSSGSELSTQTDMGVHMLYYPQGVQSHSAVQDDFPNDVYFTWGMDGLSYVLQVIGPAESVESAARATRKRNMEVYVVRPQASEKIMLMLAQGKKNEDEAPATEQCEMLERLPESEAQLEAQKQQPEAAAHDTLDADPERQAHPTAQVAELATPKGQKSTHRYLSSPCESPGGAFPIGSASLLPTSGVSENVELYVTAMDALLQVWEAGNPKEWTVTRRQFAEMLAVNERNPSFVKALSIVRLKFPERFNKGGNPSLQKSPASSQWSPAVQRPSKRQNSNRSPIVQPCRQVWRPVDATS